MKRNGFTLIELMIVIAIIGILLAVAIPAYQKWAATQRSTPDTGVPAAPATPVPATPASSS